MGLGEWLSLFPLPPLDTTPLAERVEALLRPHRPDPPRFADPMPKSDVGNLPESDVGAVAAFDAGYRDRGSLFLGAFCDGTLGRFAESGRAPVPTPPPGPGLASESPPPAEGRGGNHEPAPESGTSTRVPGKRSPTPSAEAVGIITAALRKAGRPLSRKELAREAGYSAGTIGQYAPALVSAGTLLKTADGYALPADVNQADG